MHRFSRIITGSLKHNMCHPPDLLGKPSGYLRTLASTPPFVPPELEEEEKKKEIRKGLLRKYWDKTKNMGKQYGWVFLGTYWGLWGGLTYGYYEALDMGMLQYQDWKWLHLPKLHQEYYSWGEWMGFDMSLHPINDKKEKVLIALVLGKISKVVYLPISVAITPSIARLLGRAPPESKKTLPEMKEKMEEIKEEMKEDIKQAL